MVRARQRGRDAPPGLGQGRGVLGGGGRRPPGDRDLQLVVGARPLQRPPARARSGGQARRARGRRPAARVPDDLVEREPDEADHDALSQPDVDGRRGDDPRPSAGRDRAARRVRQDGPGAADGRRQRRRPGDHAHRRARAGGLLPWPRARRRHGPLGVHRRVPGRAAPEGRVRRARGGADPVGRPLQRARHRVDPRRGGRGARDGAPRDRRDPGGRRPPRRRGRAHRPPRGRARRRRAGAGADPDPGRVRQRDYPADGARGLDQRGHPPARARRPGRGRPRPGALRRDLAADAGARQPAALRRPPVRRPVPGRRRAGRAPRAQPAARPRCDPDQRRDARRRARERRRGRRRRGGRAALGAPSPAGRPHRARGQPGSRAGP